MGLVELFKVTCVTCRAKLSVRDERLVGQILACPKCNSMVEVARPQSPADATNSMAAVAAMATQESSASLMLETPGPTGGEVATPLASLPELTSVLDNAVTAQTKMLLWSLATVVIGASATGAYLLLQNRHSHNKPPASLTHTVTASQADAPDAEPIRSNSTPPLPSPVAEADVPTAARIASVPTVAQEVSPPMLENTTASQPTVEAISVEPDPVTSKTDASEKTSPEPPAPSKLVVEPADTPRLARKFDPLRIDPDQLDLASLGSQSQSQPAESSTVALNMGREVSQPRSAKSLASMGVRLSEDHNPPLTNLAAENRIRSVFPSVAVQDMPITDFLFLISKLSGVPVSVSPEQLQMAAVAHNERVTFEAADISLFDALQRVLEPRRLEATLVGPQIVVVRQDADQVRTVDYPVNDLTGTQTTSEDFARWIPQLIAPQTWNTAGGKGTITETQGSLHIEQTQAVHYEVLFFLERIRLAKGLALRSRFPAVLLSDKPLEVVIADQLSAPTTFTFSQATPLAEVFCHWQGELGLPVFVNWSALVQENLWPESRMTCSVTNRPWSDSLDAVLGPLKLGWRAAPGGAIEITSRESLANNPRLDIYPTNQWRGDLASETVIQDSTNQLTYTRRLRLSVP